jgi:hypothetical protein
MIGGFFMGRNSFANRLKQLLYRPAPQQSQSHGGIANYLDEMSRDIDETFKIIRATAKEEHGGDEKD